MAYDYIDEVARLAAEAQTLRVSLARLDEAMARPSRNVSLSDDEKGLYYAESPAAVTALLTAAHTHLSAELRGIAYQLQVMAAVPPGL